MPLSEDDFRGESVDSFLWNVHSYLCDFIKFADVKAAALVGWNAALIRLAVAIDSPNLGGSDLSLTAYLALMLIAVATLSAIAAMLVIFPRLRSDDSGKESTSDVPKDRFIFFGTIAALGRDAYIANTNAKSTHGIAVANHNFDLALVANAKYRILKFVVRATVIGTLLYGLTYATHSMRVHEAKPDREVRIDKADEPLEIVASPDKNKG